MMTLIEFLQTAKEIMNGEEFNELRGKDKRKIFDLFLGLNPEYYTDADSDGCSLSAKFNDMQITFFSHAEESYEEEIRLMLNNLCVYIDGEEATLDEGIQYAKTIHKIPLAILNTSILTTAGTYALEDIPLDQAKDLVSTNDLDSAVGHQSTAEIMTTLLDVEIPMNRQLFTQHPGQQALVFKLNGRPEEGKILSVEEIERIGYKFQLLTRLQ